MYSIHIYDSSINKNNLSENIYFTLEFELVFNEDVIQFSHIHLRDENARIQNILDIQVSARTNNNTTRKTIGQVQTSLYVFNQHFNASDWKWFFDSEDISIIESVRNGDVSFEIEISTIIQITENETRILPFRGKGHVRFPETDWLKFIRHFGYSTKYGLDLPTTLLDDNCWLAAFDLLDDARQHMQRGKTHDALGQCLSIIESYMDSAKRGGPYSDKVWDELLVDQIPQKKDGIIRMISGISTYLNMIGHHRNSHQKENGNLPRVPIDQFEAELMVSICHLLVTYLERLREQSTY